MTKDTLMDTSYTANEIEDTPEVMHKKAMSLEHTLGKMQSYSNYLYGRMKYMQSKGQDVTQIKRKLKDVNNGIYEVFNKAHDAWTKLRVLERSAKGYE